MVLIVVMTHDVANTTKDQLLHTWDKQIIKPTIDDQNNKSYWLVSQMEYVIQTDFDCYEHVPYVYKI